MPYPSKVNAQQILEAAISILEAESWESLSMRGLAKKLGLTVSSLYRYYPEKESLEEALAEFAAHSLRQEVEKSDSLAAAGTAYLSFARTRPALFALLISKTGRPRQGEPFKRLWNALLATVSTVTGDPDDTDAAVAVWSFVHGFATLEQSGQFGESGPRRGFEKGIQALDDGLRHSNNR